MVHRICRHSPDAEQSIRIGQPSSVTVVETKVEQTGNSEWHAHEVVVWRTARLLMEGMVWVPA